MISVPVPSLSTARRNGNGNSIDLSAQVAIKKRAHAQPAGAKKIEESRTEFA
jgi:hypothetical protein